jgi:LSD1 subclass zinc finger protein
MIGRVVDSSIGATRIGGQTRQKGFESRTPVFNDKASDLVGDINETLSRWALSVAHRHGYDIAVPVFWHGPPEKYRYTSYDHAMFLAAHVSDLVNDEDVGELCSSLRNYVKRGLAIVNPPIEPMFCGPCPAPVQDHRRCVNSDGVNTCGYRPHECATSLMSPRGALEVTCPACGAVHDVQRLINSLLANADNYRGTIPELHRALRMLEEPVEMGTLYTWAGPKSKRGGSGQLKPTGYRRPDGRIGLTRKSDDDEPLYRISDARKIRLESLKPGRRGRPLKK